MDIFDLYGQEPGKFIIVLIALLITTVVSYATFPLAFAIIRKKSITMKKYKRLCYGVNFAIMLIFWTFEFNGDASRANAAPYLLWTWVFHGKGVGILIKRGLLDFFPTVACNQTGSQEADDIAEGINVDSTPLTSELFSEEEKKPHIIKFCRKCGFKLIDGSDYCSRCGTAIIKE